VSFLFSRFPVLGAIWAQFWGMWIVFFFLSFFFLNRLFCDIFIFISLDRCKIKKRGKFRFRG